MIFRKLRIAWSVAWGIVAVLLCVLWLRSYQWMEIWIGPAIGPRRFAASLSPGVLAFGFPNVPAHRLEKIYIRQDAREWWEQQTSFAGSPPYRSRAFGYFFYHDLRMGVPHWFAVLLPISIAAAPWLPLKRFSLRTLLIAVTLGCIGLGLVVWLDR